MSLVHGAGLWLCLGLNGSVATSIDGVEWDLANVGTNAPILAGAYGNGIYVASLGSRGEYVTSDGHNWSKAAGSPNLSDVTFGLGRFVGVDSSGAVWTSTNGTQWTSRQLSFIHAFSRISLANGRFFALARVNTQLYEYFISSNGEDWSNAYSLGTNGLDRVVYGNGVYVGLRMILDITGGQSEFRTSTDGMNWSAPTVFNAYNIYEVLFVDGRFVALEIYGRLLVSTNAIDWTEHAIPELFGATELGWAEGNFVSAGVMANIASSADGLNWTRRSLGPQNSLVGIVNANGTLVAVGGNLGDGGSTLSRSTIVISSNGKDWTEREPHTTNSLAAVTFGAGRYVAVGAAGTIVTSSDGLDWLAVPALTTNTLNGVAYGNGRFVAVGGDTLRATILSSSNGVDWSAQAEAINYRVLYGITFGGGQFVAVGRTNSSRQGTILTSADGFAWTPRSTTTTNTLRAVGFGGGVFVATGDRGAILNSADGAVWTDYSRATTRSLRAVAYGNGQWIIVSSPVGHYTSPDGMTWTFRSSLALTTVVSTYGVAYGGDSFFIVGSWGQILESRRFHPTAADTVLRLRYLGAPFLRLSGAECSQYEIQSSDTLPLVGSVPWAMWTTVSNMGSTVTIPVGTGTEPPSRFFRAVRLP